MTDAATPPAIDTATPESPPAAKVVQLRARVQEGADALNDWAHGQAHALAGVAKQKPLAAAGISAATAFAAGLVFGLLLAQTARAPSWKDRILDFKPNW